MFRVFDMNEDGVISRSDLISGLNLLYSGTILEQNMILKIADKIMRECEAYEGDAIQLEGKTLFYFNRIEFSNAMQDSDIVKNCTIAF